MTLPPFQVKAVYEYSSPHDDDLSFPVGQVITVTEEEGDDWYYGEFADHNGSKQEGLFPRNFVKNYEPETPPRPSRPNRPKKEGESSKAPAGATPHAEPEAIAAQAPEEGSSNLESRPKEDSTPLSGLAESAKPPPPARQNSAVTKPSFPASSKLAPLPPSESTAKPSSGSFKDRINAFNKPAAPPVAPTKPSGLGSSSGSGFVKKAFVAPPPSKNAYVPIPREPPPQKVYRREEELQTEAQAQAQPTGEDEPTSRLASQQTSESVDDEADQPKPTSLKERIALLQKQQMEQAARQADAAQRKEKPKRPPKKRMESQERFAEKEVDPVGEPLEEVNSGDTMDKRSMDLPRVQTDPRTSSTVRGPESPEGTPLVSPTGPPRQFLSDPNDADMSGAADTEEGEDTSTSRDEKDAKPQGISQVPSSQRTGALVGDQSEQVERKDFDQDEDEEEDVDPEVKRRMEIRERMAKMSGGMGMAGMFGPPGGMAPMAPKRQGALSGERKSSGNERSPAIENTASRAPPVPMMPMPGLTKVRSPELDTTPKGEVSKEDEEDIRTSVTQGRSPEEMPDIEDLEEEPVMPSRRSTERSLPPPVPHERPVPPPPSQIRGAPPPPPSTRPVPPPPSEPKSRLSLPPSQVLSPSEGSESDDEMSVRARNLSLRIPTSDDSRPVSREGPPPMPPGVQPPSLPSRPKQPLAQDQSGVAPADIASDEASPTSPVTPSIAAKRSSRPPPIPGSSPVVPPPNSQNRAPPPPPPTSAPPSRVQTGDMRAPPPIPKASAPHDSDEEITEYEGDYDTDIASGASHKAALKSHSKEAAKNLDPEDDSENNTAHQNALSPLESKASLPTRAVPPPPPPPNQPPKGPRQSSDMPRAAPPPPPPPKEQSYNEYEEVHDPYDRSGVDQYVAPTSIRRVPEEPAPPRDEDEDDLYSASPPQRNVPASPAMPSSQIASPPSLSAPSRTGARQSLDVQRTSTSGRRSMEASRLSSDQGFIAVDIDLGYGSQWWIQPNMPPPVLQNRRDIIYEIEDSTASRRGGRQAVTRSVYVLYMDYSQTIIAAHFETRDPSEASLEQHHEPPPSRLRQDQLEDAHTRFGARIAEAANAKKESTVGDGSPHALVLDLIASLPEALRPVGVRAYGALVYANLANASVQQFDEIRSGDIITFRNARFQGHRGAMHSKYNVDIGKQDHVGIVVDWDGTKKKVRALEQGRESRKVKMESFKLGDMKSGEVKVWRVMARQWVGWE